MKLTYEQMMSVIEEFEDRNPALAMNAAVHTISLEIAEKDCEGKAYDEPSLQIRVHAESPLSEATLAFLPKSHRCNVVGLDNLELPVVLVRTPKPALEVLQGHAISQVGSTSQGTVGHNFFVQGVGHCVMSNHHVLATPNTAAGQDLETQNPDATPNPWSRTADLQAWLNNQTFDYALGLYRNAADCESAYRPCADGNVRPFAGEFADGLSINERHFKVGLTTRCTTGNLLGVANIGQIGGVDRRGQLVFERMTQAGDSGSVVVHEATNRIVGLHFAGFDHPTNPALSRSYSNPIYRVGFRLIGFYQLTSGGKVPIYDASNAIVPVTPQQSVAFESDFTLAARGASLRFNELQDSVNFIGGKLFLGVLPGNLIFGTSLRVYGDEPLPVSGGEIVRVIVNRGTPDGFGHISCTVMYFG